MATWLLVGIAIGMAAMAAILIGAEVRFERRKTSLSATPLSIQTLFAKDSGQEFSQVRS